MGNPEHKRRMRWHESGVPPQSVLLPKLASASELLLQEIAVLKQNTENEDIPDDSVMKLIDEESGAVKTSADW